MPWERTMRCMCRKKKHPTEQAALDWAARDAQTFDAVVTVYRCPGSTAWHVSHSGFTPAGLVSYGRRFAYELVLHPDGVHIDDFRARVLGLEVAGKGWSRARMHANRLTRLGVCRPRPSADGGRPTGWYELVNEAAARRVVQLGVDGYEQERSLPDSQPAPTNPT